jgi:hypothetical protein
LHSTSTVVQKQQQVATLSSSPGLLHAVQYCVLPAPRPLQFSGPSSVATFVFPPTSVLTLASVPSAAGVRLK